MIQRLWLLPIQEDQMVVLFDMRRGGGVVLGTRVEVSKRALNTRSYRGELLDGLQPPGMSPS